MDALLSMSDPDHVPSPAAAPAQPPEVCQPVLTARVSKILIIKLNDLDHTRHSTFRPRKPNWTRSLHGSCSSRTNNAMRAIRSRDSSNSSSANSPMRSVRPQLLFRSSRAAVRPRRVPPHNGRGTRCRMCRTNSLSWQKVRHLRYCHLFSLIFVRRFFGAMMVVGWCTGLWGADALTTRCVP